MMATLEICDICNKPMYKGSFIDQNGHLWDGISFQEKQFRTKKCSFGDSWTEYLSICGHCRYMLSTFNVLVPTPSDGETE